MDKKMKEAKEFILKFFAKEVETWTKYQSGDSDLFKKSVEEFYGMAIDDLDESLGILKTSQVKKEDKPMVYQPRYLFKLSAYKNKIYDDVWVAYASIKNPISKAKESVISHGFIIAEIEGELKIIGTMMIYKNRSTMKIEGWRESMYNPSDLDISNFGEFVAVERYSEPGDYDDFSLKEYLKDK